MDMDSPFDCFGNFNENVEFKAILLKSENYGSVSSFML